MIHTPGPWHTPGADILSEHAGRVAVAMRPEGSGPVPEEERKANILIIQAAPTMLETLKLIEEECVCDDFENRCKRCGWARERHIPPEGDYVPPEHKLGGHDYITPKPCLGCQVSAAIKLAEKGE